MLSVLLTSRILMDLVCTSLSRRTGSVKKRGALLIENGKDVHLNLKISLLLSTGNVNQSKALLYHIIELP